MSEFGFLIMTIMLLSDEKWDEIGKPALKRFATELFKFLDACEECGIPKEKTAKLIAGVLRDYREGEVV